MKVTVARVLGCSPANNYWVYILEAENGLIERTEESVYLLEGTVLDLPDEAWQPDSEDYAVQCDGCGHVYTARSLPGYAITCPVCGTQEIIPEGGSGD